MRGVAVHTMLRSSAAKDPNEQHIFIGRYGKPLTKRGIECTALHGRIMVRSCRLTSSR